MGTYTLLAQNNPQTVVSQTNLAKADITEVGMNMFSMAHTWEKWNFATYRSDAFIWFSSKINQRIKNTQDNSLKEIVRRCDNCDDIVESGFDSSLAEYFQKNSPDLLNWGEVYFLLVNPYLNKKIRTSNFTADTRRALNNLIESMVSSILSQVSEQMNIFRDVSNMWLYYDGDSNNSPYDLLDDIRRIDEVFFREAPMFWPYKNTSKTDASALITGQKKEWSWIDNTTDYHINILDDIKKALWEKWENDSMNEQDNQKKEECQDWYCINVDFISNTHYFLENTSNSIGKNSFQWIFEEALDWIVKNGDKRNFACKTATTINFFETENDMNLQFNKIFNGSSIFTFWKIPKFVSGFLDRDKDKNSDDWKMATEKKENMETEDALKRAFTARGIRYDQPTDLYWTAEKAFSYAWLENGSVWYQSFKGIWENVTQSKNLYPQVLYEYGKWNNRALIHENSKDSIQHLEKAFDEIALRASLFHQFSLDMNHILHYLQNKPDCWN